MVNFTVLSRYPRAKRAPLDRRLGGAQSQSGHYGEEINLLPLPEMEPRFIGHPVQSLVAVPASVSRFQTTRLAGIYRIMVLPALLYGCETW
jgi:hypothetical protein